MKDFLSIFEELSGLNSEVINPTGKILTESYKLTEAADDSDVEADVSEEVLEQENTKEETPAQLVLECSKCGALVIKGEADVEIDSETDLANVKDTCEFCEETEGYKVLGALAPHEFADEIEVEDDETDVEEQADDELEEGIFGGNDYKDKDFLVYRGQGKDEVIAIGKRNGSDHNLYNYKQAHIEKNGSKASDYAIVASTKPAIKKYKKSLKTADDVSTKLPFWVQKFVTADEEKRTQDFRNAEAQKEREAQARRDAERDRYRNRKEHNPDDDYVYIKGNGSGTYKYREDLEEGAFSGGYASDRGEIDRWARAGGPREGAKYEVYLTNLVYKNPDKIKIVTIKAKDIKPGMITQAGEVKEAEMRRTNQGDTQMYIMHTNNWDGFWEADADMEVMATIDSDSPFIGTYSDLRKMGLKEGIFDFGKKKREKEAAAIKAAEEEERARAEAKKKRDELQRLYDRADIDNQRDTWKKEQEERDARRAYERKRYNEIQGDKPSNTPYKGVNYSGGDYYSEDLDADTHELDELFNLVDVDLDARGFGGSGNDVSVL